MKVDEQFRMALNDFRLWMLKDLDQCGNEKLCNLEYVSNIELIEFLDY
jgi:hypothetical protein